MFRATSAPVAAIILILAAGGGQLPAQEAESSFVSSAVCSDCHSRLNPPGTPANFDGLTMVHNGEPVAPIDPDSVAPFALWSSSMMAHAAVDPYWQAKVRFEGAENPAATAVIENTCLSCHAPGQQYDQGRGGTPMRLDDLAEIGLEGVTCTSCHQMDPANLGTRESFTAGFVINDRKEIYGPHQEPFPMPMRMHTGRTPTYSDHMLESDLCGTCHTVITPVLDASGKTTGEFLEQGTYLEWVASSYPSSDKTCQSCHMPQLTDEDGEPAKQYIAHTPHGGYFGPIRPREPFGQHSFMGANVQMLVMLAEQYPEKAKILQNAAERARGNLADSMVMSVRGRELDGAIEAEVTVVNRAGHKLPSGFPSRRLWLHLTVTDSAGTTVFESGAYDAESGELLAAHGGAIEPHRTLITSPDQTMIYEAETSAPGGAHTLSLLRASGFLKDNRILPAGFDESRIDIEGVEGLSLAPIGVDGDGDFQPGADTVTYRMPKSGQGPWQVTVEALYQSIKPAHTKVFDAGRTDEEASFLKAFKGHKAPIVVESETAAVGVATKTGG